MSQDTASDQPLQDRGDNRSQKPSSPAFRAFIADGWGPRPEGLPERSPAADPAALRRAAVGRLFPGERLVVPAGQLVVRSNDTDYRFRPHSAFAHLTGLGTDLEPDAVLVLHPLDEADGGRGGAAEATTGEPATEATTGEPATETTDTQGTDEATGIRATDARPTHEAVLYFRPRAGRDTEEFYGDSRYGELWVGARPSLAEMAAVTGLRVEHIDSLADALAKDVGAGQVQLRVVPAADAAVSALVEKLRAEAGVTTGTTEADARLAEALSELRLRKDDHEVGQVREAVAATARGFEDVIRSFPRAVAHPRGERVVEGAFEARAREEGNGTGYETIAAAGEHASTLHWITNDGQVRPGQLVLVDAGVEVDSLYTADITRTLPVDGVFSAAQRQVYEAVLAAADAAFARAGRPGTRFKDVHAAAMEVIAARLEEWGMLPGTAAESLAPEGQFHRRWMVHGTSHHLGLDVHDCAQARREMYLEAELAPGMIFTIEPGLYFRADDLKVPAELRGISVRIEDDILVRPDGSVENLSAAIPRTVADVEAWVARLRG
ncbi:Xaa-Pro aminopeptidase [Georgenia sp. TF02-10]|uniref:aminopeptidase P family protein n=1 Tax=Georgenia sp. TF02-10 TaxID=2917725 RepID=UPI001FA77B79|nr:aminopeptidase P family protein [Georgenia sp. TF02-10]UNX54167.1 Xaa-Pro aminopeptidase [Georgenia sp. TF02-10]